ncbi:AAA family ATPase [Bradyrhizobium sp. HKCCYLS3013]|uniref:AAA family ATPase n=1 Tax=Bradyrhizobium sp. HKCCYLS3013 TaxID=3420735 RepID=UPI003EB91242
MRLIKARATNYRNIIDSNEVEIAQTTCLVGKNEAGKSAFLKAIEGIRSVDPNFKDYGKIENYPRRHLADYAERHPDGVLKSCERIGSLTLSTSKLWRLSLDKGR